MKTQASKTPSLSRRDFLKASLAGAFSLALLPGLNKNLTPRANTFSQTEESLAKGRVATSSILVYKQPTSKSKMIGSLKLNTVLNITEIVVGEEEPSYNRIWYKLEDLGYAHSGNIQPVTIEPNQPNFNIPSKGFLTEVTIPFTEARWHPNNQYTVAYKLYHGCTFWAIDIIEGINNTYWYKILDDEGYSYYVDATALKVLKSSDIAPISSEVPLKQKRLEVILDEQVVIAYEYDQPVFMSRAATGARFYTGDFSTPKGQFITNRKRPSRHMVDNAGSSYDLPGVPWVCYITENGVAFHGTFWHNDFGRPRSHGCINLSNQAAKWIYLWTSPKVPLGQKYWAEMEGTRVDVI